MGGVDLKQLEVIVDNSGHYDVLYEDDKEMWAVIHLYLLNLHAGYHFKPRVFVDGDYAIIERIHCKSGKRFTVKISKKTLDVEFGRWPYYGIIGKPVSEEQAFNTISEHYPFKAKKSHNEDSYIFNDKVDFMEQYVHIPAWDMSGDQTTWVRPDGKIGLFDSSWEKLPDLSELIYKWEDLCTIKDIDVYIGLTGLDSAPCMTCPYCHYVYQHYTRHKIDNINVTFDEDKLSDAEMLQLLCDGDYLNEDEFGYRFACNREEFSSCRKVLSIKNYVLSNNGYAPNSFINYYNYDKIPGNIADYVIAVIHITEDMCEVRSDKDVLKEYCDVLKKYYPDGPQEYDSGYVRASGKALFDESFIKRCLQKIGIEDGRLDDVYQIVIARYR